MVNKKQFSDVEHISHDGLVFVGVSDPLVWSKGMMELLVKERIVFDIDCFLESFYVTTKNNRIDVILPFAEKAKIKMSMLMEWYKHCKNAYWVFDYVEHFKKECV